MLNMRTLKSVAAILRREMHKYLKIIYLDAFKSIFEPLFFVLVFGLGLGRNVNIGETSYFEFMAPGVVFMVAVTCSYARTSFGLFNDKEYDKIMNSFLVGPLKPSEIVLGYILAGTIQALICSGCFMLILHFAFGLDFKSTSIFVLFLIIISIFFSCIGVILCMSVNDAHSLLLITNFLINPLSFLCGVFIPTDYLPTWVQPAVGLIPLTKAIQGIRMTPLSLNNPDVALSLIYIAVAGVVSFMIGTYIFRKKVLT